MSIEVVPEGFLFAPAAGANLTGKLYYLAKMSADFAVVLAAAGTDQVVGVIKEENTSGNPVTVQYGGISKVLAGGTISAGNRLTSDGSGKAVATTTAGDKVFGVALMAADSGDIISVLLVTGHVATS
jgi:Uncharacterized conserved protein (DUF2190)